MGVVYKILCTTNGKFYIGSTVNKRQRWSQHRVALRKGAHKNKNMQASWDKYGEAAFEFSVLSVVESPAQLMAAEQALLDTHVGDEKCFNHNRFADCPWRGKSGEGTPNFNRPVPPEVRAKISAALSGENHPNWGRALKPDTRAKISAAQETNPWRGARHTAEAIAKIAAASRGRPVSLATRAKRSAAMQGHEVTALTRAKISATLSGEGNYWYGKKRPDHGAKVSRAVVATAPDGTETRYESILALREALSLKPPTVNRAVKSGTPLVRGPYKGWQFRYAVT